MLLRPGQRPGGWLGWFFERVNRFIDWTRRQYEEILKRLTRVKAIVVGIFILSLGVTGWLYISIPTAFIPDDDQGYFITLIQGPEGVSLNYTSKVMAQVEKEILKLPEVTGTFAIGGFGFSGNSANSGAIFSTLEP